jgi:predicted CXXCH cytochrome family protein
MLLYLRSKENPMKTILVLIMILIPHNLYAQCGYTSILNSDLTEKIRFEVNIKQHSNQIGTISFGDSDKKIDEISQSCLSCHDGITTKMASNTISGTFSLKNSHPIGTDYNSVSFSGGFVNYQNVNRNITFVDGRVSCISCHDITNTELYHLTVNNSRSQLCLSCHIK